MSEPLESCDAKPDEDVGLKLLWLAALVLGMGAAVLHLGWPTSAWAALPYAPPAVLAAWLLWQVCPADD